MDYPRSYFHIKADGLYTISDAARYLGVHRCTIYDYVSNPERPLPVVRHPGNSRLRFPGAALMAFKAAGLPKKGPERKREAKQPQDLPAEG